MNITEKLLSILQPLIFGDVKNALNYADEKIINGIIYYTINNDLFEMDIDSYFDELEDVKYNYAVSILSNHDMFLYTRLFENIYMCDKEEELNVLKNHIEVCFSIIFRHFRFCKLNFFEKY